MPLWGALETECAGTFAPRIEVWKTTAHLLSMLLAGKGDLWVGNVDGFARARARGAPVVLIAVTGWRKFSLVSTKPTVQAFTDFAHRELPYAPMGCPSVDILRAVYGTKLDTVDFVPYEPKQLALHMLQGRIHSALLPEPLVTVLLRKVPDLRLIAHVEDEYARINGGRARMPIAGIAVHAKFLRQHPREVASLAKGIMVAARRLAATPERAPRVLPETFAHVVSRADVEASLERDGILAVSAAEAREEILRYVHIVAPDVFSEKATLDAEFFGVSETPRK